MFQLPFSIFMMRNSFEAVPRELEEAALVDGCTTFSALCADPAAGGAAGADHGRPVRVPRRVERLLRAADPDQRHRQVHAAARGGRTCAPGRRRVDYGATEAGVVVLALPCIVLFLFLQRHYVRGFMSGALGMTMTESTSPAHHARGCARLDDVAHHRRLLGRRGRQLNRDALLPHVEHWSSARLDRQLTTCAPPLAGGRRAAAWSSPTPRSTSSSRPWPGRSAVAGDPRSRRDRADVRSPARRRPTATSTPGSAAPARARATPTSSGATSSTASATCSRPPSPARARRGDDGLRRRSPAAPPTTCATPSARRHRARLRPPRDRDGARRAGPG